MKATERYQESKKLIGFAVSKNPDTLYAASGNPLPSRLASTIQYAITSSHQQEHASTIDEDIASLLQYGIRDTQSALDPYLRKQRSYESALEFIDHPRTTQAIAVLALRNEESMTHLIQDIEPTSQRNARPDSSHLELPYSVTPAEKGGCPAAMHSDPEKINPLFRRFVQWSGRLALKSLSYHGIAENLKK